jgi:hypothetical protein
VEWSGGGETARVQWKGRRVVNGVNRRRWRRGGDELGLRQAPFWDGFGA